MGDGSSGDIRSVVSGHGVEVRSGAASGAIRAREACSVLCVSLKSFFNLFIFRVEKYFCVQGHL